MTSDNTSIAGAKATTKTITQDPEIHINPEYEQLVSPLTTEEYDSLKDSIKENGQKYPVLVNHKGEIIDGHHRFKICRELERPVRYYTQTFKNKLDEIQTAVELNIQRRQLTDAQKIEIGHKLKPVLQEVAKQNQSIGGKGGSPDQPLGSVDDVIAKKVGLSATKFKRGETILEEYPDLWEKYIKKENKPINAVLNKIKTQEKKEQFREIARTAKLSIPNGCRLIQGSFIEACNEVEDNSIDLIFTDPPYDKESLYLYSELAKVAQRVLKPGCQLVYYTAHYFVPEIMKMMLDAGLTYHWLFCVKYPVGHEPIHAKHIFHDWKPLGSFIKGDKQLEGLPYMSDVIESGHPVKDLHDWQQSPIEAKHIIEKLTAEGNTVLDPMLGAGTTGVVALQLKRQFIGIEIDEDTFDKAQYRISHPELEPIVTERPSYKDLEEVISSQRKTIEEHQRIPSNDALVDRIDQLKKENAQLIEQLGQQLPKGEASQPSESKEWLLGK